MSDRMRVPALFALVVGLIIVTGNLQSWNAALFILNMGLISAIMSLGLNLQWGIAGLLNVGVMGFVALGGLATVIVSMDPVPAAWDAGGLRILFGLAIGALTISIAIFAYRKIQNTPKTFLKCFWESWEVDFKNALRNVFKMSWGLGFFVAQHWENRNSILSDLEWQGLRI